MTLRVGPAETRAATGEMDSEVVEEPELEADLEEISEDEDVELPAAVPEEEEESEW